MSATKELKNGVNKKTFSNYFFEELVQEIKISNHK